MEQPLIVVDVELLEGILAGTTSLIAGTPAQSAKAKTPCPEFDVTVLTNHLVGFMRRFETVLTVGKTEENSAAYVAGDDPAAEYAQAATAALATWRIHDPESPVVLTGGPMPRKMVYCVMLVETVTHGWDLAKGTGQPIPFTEQQAAAALKASRLIVKPEYRGPGLNFQAEVPVAQDAHPIDRLVGYTGRDPGWAR